MKKYLHLIFACTFMLFMHHVAASVSNMIDVDGKLSPQKTPHVGCAGDMTFDVLIENIGFDADLNGFILKVYLDDAIKEEIKRDTVLGAFGRFTETITLSDVAKGMHTIRVELETNNDDVESNPNDNQIEFAYNAVEDGIVTVLELATDYFPSDLGLFCIIDKENNMDTVFRLSNIDVNEWNPARYQTSHELCLPEGCYDVYIKDNYGDGWSKSADAFLNISQKSDGKFALKEYMDSAFDDFEKSFCIPVECNPTDSLTAEYEHATAPGVSDAAIVVNYGNADEETEYSIDGGVNYQKSNVFFQLSEGTYTITVRDGKGCLYELTVNITASIDEQIRSSIRLHPNPADQALNIDYGRLSTKSIKHVQIINTLGAVMYQQEHVQFSSDRLDISTLASGMYFYVIATQEGNIVKRFVRK